MSYYHFDGLGSTRLLSDSGGTITDTYHYDAFGNLIARTGTTENEFMFTGQQHDANVGFYYQRARYYQPDTGRFTAFDPFAGVPYTPASLHKYSYAANDPVNKIDPNGMSFMSLSGALIVFSLLNVIPSFSFAERNTQKGRKWTAADANAFATWVPNYVGKYSGALDCADLAIVTVIEFAKINRLHLDFNLPSQKLRYNESNFINYELLKHWARKSLGARNIADNTKSVSVGQARAGDVLLFNWNQSPQIPNGNHWHTFLWINSAKFYYGNLDENDNPVALDYTTPSRPTPSGYHPADLLKHGDLYGGSPRRWKFIP